jgi:ABC-type multidrug transport system ATPase subunit
MNNQPLIEVVGLGKAFGDKVLFQNLNFKIDRGQKVALKGPSGAGKSTLLHILMGFMGPDEGQVFINGERLIPSSVRKIRTMFSWVPQEFPFTGRAGEILVEPFQFEVNKKKKPGSQDLMDTLEIFGLSEDLMDKDISALSGGEKQRLILASVNLLGRDIILLDEPVASLDQKNCERVIDRFLKDPKYTVIAASHTDLWVNSCDLIIDLGNGYN